MARAVSLSMLLLACRGAAATFGECDEAPGCVQDESSLLQHKVQAGSLDSDGKRLHYTVVDGYRHLLRNPHDGSNESTCAGGPNPSVEHCPQHECYGRSSCCCGSGRCKDKPRDICVQVNECSDPPCGTNSIPGFPVAVKEMLPAYHPTYIIDGCSCPGVQGCDPTEPNTVCWGQMTCDMHLMSKCRRTGYCSGLLNKQAIVGSFCITDGNPKQFTFCSAKTSPETRRRRSFCRRRRADGRRRGRHFGQALLTRGDGAEGVEGGEGREGLEGGEGGAAKADEEVEYGPDYRRQNGRSVR